MRQKRTHHCITVLCNIPQDKSLGGVGGGDDLGGDLDDSALDHDIPRPSWVRWFSDPVKHERDYSRTLARRTKLVIAKLRAFCRFSESH